MTQGVPPGFAPSHEGGDFIALIGPLHMRLDGGGFQLGFRVERRHVNGLGICHGGMMATFCDMLLPLGSRQLAAQLRGRFLPTVSLQVDYLAATPLGSWVQGEAQVLRTTRTLVFAQGLVTADGQPAARVSGVLKIGGLSAVAAAPD